MSADQDSRTYHPNLTDNVALTLVYCILRIHEIAYQVVESMQDEPNPPRFFVPRKLRPMSRQFTETGLVLLVTSLPAEIVSPWGNISFASSCSANWRQANQVMQHLKERGVLLEQLRQGSGRQYIVSSIEGIDLPRAEIREQGSAFLIDGEAIRTFGAALAAVQSR